MPRPLLSHLAHVELLTPRLEESTRFMIERLGLNETAGEGDSVYLRCWGDFYHHSVVLTRADQPALGHAAWRAYGPEELDIAVANLERAGVEGEWLEESVGHGRAYRFKGPGGHVHEVFWEVERYTAPPELRSIYPDRPSKYFGQPARQLDHVTVGTRDVKGTAEWYRDTLHFRFMAYNGLEEDPDTVVFGVVTTNEKSHDLGLGADFSNIPGRLHHLAFWIESRDELYKAADMLMETGSGVEFGPGQHGIGEQAYLYFREPGGVRIELNSGGYRHYVPDWEPNEWKPSQGSNVQWRNATFPPEFMEAFPPATEGLVPEAEAAQAAAHAGWQATAAGKSA